MSQSSGENNVLAGWTDGQTTQRCNASSLGYLWHGGIKMFINQTEILSLSSLFPFHWLIVNIPDHLLYLFTW